MQLFWLCLWVKVLDRVGESNDRGLLRELGTMPAPGGLTAWWRAHNLEERVDPRPTQTELRSQFVRVHTQHRCHCVTQVARLVRQRTCRRTLGRKPSGGKCCGSALCPVPGSEDAVGNWDLKMGCAGLSLCSLNVLGCWASSQGSFAQAVLEQ